MRAVETAKKFDSLDIARAFLHSLHIDYPDATIPGKDVVHVMVYNRKLNEEAPFEKITLKAKPLPEGGAKLMVKTQSKKKKVARPSDTAEPQGKFTALVKKKRTGKKT